MKDEDSQFEKLRSSIENEECQLEKLRLVGR